VLLTDGVNTDTALDPLVVAQATAQLGIQVFTVGLGRPGAVPFPQQGANGPYVVQWESLLDEALLQKVAEQTNATYLRVTAATAEDLPVLALPKPTAVSTKIALPILPPVDLFPWLIIGAVGLLLVELWLGQTILFTLPEDG
jgi:hypothetical protein